MPDHDAVLFANEAFYRAFADRDLGAMDRLWAKGGPVVCIHPGWAALASRREIMDSWRRILSSDRSPAIVCRQPQAFLFGDLAFVVCYEEIDGNYLVATNAFRREGRTWKMVHHQAGPSAAPPPADEEEPPAPRAN